MVSHHLKMLVRNMLSDGGDEFLGGKNLEVLLVAPMGHAGAIEELAGILEIGGLLLKESAVASQRCYVVEVMGYDWGYLALMGGLATGAERIHLPEQGIALNALRDDVARLKEGFRHGKRLGLIIRSEHADPLYTTEFLSTLFEKQGAGVFDGRRSILVHIQQGGRPTPFDRRSGGPTGRQDRVHEPGQPRRSHGTRRPSPTTAALGKDHHHR